MSRAVLAFGRNDVRNLRRESLLFGIVFAPLVWIAMVRLATPPVTDLVAARYGVDLVPHYPVILTAFLLLTSPIVVGGVGAFLVLDERDAGTFAVLLVMPTPMRSYLGYRAATVVAVTATYVVATMAASGLVPLGQMPALVPIGLLTGLSGLVIGLVLLRLARNMVKGLAVMRALGIVVAGLPLIPYFLGPQWQYPFWLLPPYWPAKTYWLLSTGDTWWPYLLAGIAYHVPLIWLLYRRFLRSLD
ncbi:MAG: ABC transporter permease [Streptosporangiales bacterium]|nr:ABC transporter permease [Streptosporangiales bacterium]